MMSTLCEDAGVEDGDDSGMPRGDRASQSFRWSRLGWPHRSRSWLAILLAAITCGLCRGQHDVPPPLSRTGVRLPVQVAGGGRGAAGIEARIELGGLFGAGYVGVDIELRSTRGALAAARDLTLRLIPTQRHLPAEQAMTIELPLTVEQGEQLLRVRRAFPKWTLGDTYRVELSERGTPLPGCVAEVGRAFSRYAAQTPVSVLHDELLTNVLLVDTELAGFERPAGVQVFRSSRMQQVQTRSLASLPVDWRGLSDLDLIVLDFERWSEREEPQGDESAAELEGLEGSFEAIRQWTMMGGTLVVLNAPEASALSRRLGLTLQTDPEQQQLFRDQYQAVLSDARQRLALFGRAVESPPPSLPSGDPPLPSFGPPSPSPSTPGMPGPPVEVRPEWFAPGRLRAIDSRWLETYRGSIASFQARWSKAQLYGALAGAVVGVPAERIGDGHALDLMTRWLSYRVSPMLRRGVDPLMGDARYRRWLIPGVAEPPVYTFIAVLTLFVVLVGPVAYRWTTRAHRSHLMFVIAPLLALLTTAAMFGYSILADGFGTSVRVRQLTWIDGASGDAAERTRLTLFSGLSPRDGLRFDAGTEVMPYPRGGEVAWNELPSDVDQPRLRATITDASQRLDPGLLPSRTQSQFVSHRIRRKLGRLALVELPPLPTLTEADAESSSSEAMATVKSNLPFELRDLVLRSRDGRYWAAESVAGGGTASAEWLPELRSASQRLGRLYTRFRPVGTSSRTTGTSRRNQQIRDLLAYMNRQIDRNLTITDGRFENWLLDRLFIRGELPPGTFVAVGGLDPDVVPVADAEPIASVRYVMGALP